MSNTIRIALVGEGVTDYIVLKAAIESMLNGRSFVLNLLQPDESIAFTGGGDVGELGGGWRGVYKWCGQAAARGDGQLRNDPLFVNHDLLILHLDADVASQDPANYRIAPIPALAEHLPCEEPCPPPEASTNPLRQLMLTWAGETETPPNTVLCTPSKSMEAWVMFVFFPDDREMNKRGWECHPAPDVRLAQQKLSRRFSKHQSDYEARKSQMQARWPHVAANLTEAARFQDDFKVVVQELLE